MSQDLLYLPSPTSRLASGYRSSSPYVTKRIAKLCAENLKSEKYLRFFYTRPYFYWSKTKEDRSSGMIFNVTHEG